MEFVEAPSVLSQLETDQAAKSYKILDLLVNIQASIFEKVCGVKEAQHFYELESIKYTFHNMKSKRSGQQTEENEKTKKVKAERMRR